MIDPDLSCHQQHRRDDVRAASVFGLDYAEVNDDQLIINVYFLGRAPKLRQYHSQPATISAKSITAASRILPHG